MLS
ncbi:hypothetical protein SOVF_016170, partial [Spinacia oleracea]|jgi:hypothetical protein